MFSKISLDTILSDPTLLVGLVLLVLGPLIFIYSIFRIISIKKTPERRFVIPQEPEPSVPEKPNPPQSPDPDATLVQKQSTDPSSPTQEMTSQNPSNLSQDVSDLQAQVEIAISQIKTLNKKIYDLEQSQELIEKHQSVRLDKNELQEPPMNPSDFTNKLLKLAEHVIILEKEMARIKVQTGEAAANPQSPPPSSNPPKPPIMPL